MQPQKGISTVAGISIIILVAVILFGGVFAYEYYFVKAPRVVSASSTTKNTEANQHQTTPTQLTKKVICSYTYDQVGSTISPDIMNGQYQNGLNFFAEGTDCAVLVKKTDGYAVDVNGVVTSTYPFDPQLQANVSPIGLDFYDAAFSPDGKQFAFIVVEPNTDQIILNGVAGAVYSSISNPQFSSDGKSFGYCAIQGINRGAQNAYATATYFSVINGMETQITAGAQETCNLFPDSTLKNVTQVNGFSATSPNGAYALSRDMSACPNMMADCQAVKMSLQNLATGKVTEFGNYWDAQGAVFSPDSQHFAYVANPLGMNNAPDSVVVIDGKNLSDAYDEIWNLSFSSDSNYLTYNARLDTTVYYITQPLGN